MTVEMTLEGDKAVADLLKDLQAQVGSDIADAMLVTGNLVAGEARKSVQHRSMGAAVMRYHRGRSTPKAHIASRPGDAPNTDTGQLVKNITVVIKRDGVYVGVGRAGVREYAEALEFAKKSKNRRPFMGPAITKHAPAARQRMQKVLDKVAARGS